MSSPIETALFEALAEHIDHGATRGEHVLMWPALYIGGKAELDGSHLCDEGGLLFKTNKPAVLIARQVRIRGYFADLLLWSKDLTLAVECDGHDFHERTRQQAAADRARDRELLRFGVTTIRFTGSEIHRDANQCALEVIATWRAIDERLGYRLDERSADGLIAGQQEGERACRWHAQRRELDKGPGWLRDLVFIKPEKVEL